MWYSITGADSSTTGVTGIAGGGQTVVIKGWHLMPVDLDINWATNSQVDTFSVARMENYLKVTVGQRPTMCRDPTIRTSPCVESSDEFGEVVFFDTTSCLPVAYRWRLNAKNSSQDRRAYVLFFHSGCDGRTQFFTFKHRLILHGHKLFRQYLLQFIRLGLMIVAWTNLLIGSMPLLVAACDLLNTSELSLPSSLSG
jgi:hypothetical protein